MSTREERPKRSDQLPEDGPESLVPDDVPPEDPESAEHEVEKTASTGDSP
jgi:hypothetical protein